MFTIQDGSEFFDHLHEFRVFVLNLTALHTGKLVET